MSRPSRQTPSGSREYSRINPTGLKPVFSSARIAAALSAAGSIVRRSWPRSSTSRRASVRTASVPRPWPWNRGARKRSIPAFEIRLALLLVLDYPAEHALELHGEGSRVVTHLGHGDEVRLVGRAPTSVLPPARARSRRGEAHPARAGAGARSDRLRAPAPPRHRFRRPAVAGCGAPRGRRRRAPRGRSAARPAGA
jgi:hypothetical protein